MADRYTVVTDFARPDPAQVQRASEALFLFAAMAAGPRQVMDPAIKPLDPAWRICGPAFTARAEHAEDSAMGYLANVYAKPGDVIVIDAGGRTDCGVFGASMARGAQQAGAVGVVIDGMCESAGNIVQREKLPVFCRGASRHIIAQERAGWLNGPVICGGVIVNPGDVVIGDGDGVAVIPQDQLERVVIEAEARSQRYRGPNRIQDIPFLESHKEPLARLHALPGVTWMGPKKIG